MAISESSEPDAQREQRITTTALWRIMPLVLLMMLVSYMDRVNLGVLGSAIQQDLGMGATALGFAAGVFYLGYVVFEVPSNLALTKFGSRRWLARIMVSWGLVTALTFYVDNAQLFYVMRFLLGAMEAGLSPGILLFLTHWFSRATRKRAWAVFQISIPLGLIIGTTATSALLAATASFADDAGWRWVFLVEGAATVALGLVVLRLLPERPVDAAWLSADDREFLTLRLDREQAEEAACDPYAGTSERTRVFLALKSGVAWYFSLTYFLMILGFWAIPYWLPQIIGQRFATSSVVSGYLSALPWLVVLVSILVVNWSSRRTGDTRWHMVCCLAAGAGGLWISSATSSGVVAIASLAIAGAGMQSAGSLFYHYQVGAFRGIMVAVVLAMVNSVGNVGGFIGPFVFGYLKDVLGSDVVGLRALACVFAAAAVLAVGLERTLLDPQQRRDRSRRSAEVRPDLHP